MKGGLQLWKLAMSNNGGVVYGTAVCIASYHRISQYTCMVTAMRDRPFLPSSTVHGDITPVACI